MSPPELVRPDDVHDRREAVAVRPTIVAFAYDAHPDRGSEPAAGWAGVRLLAGFADVTVVTRSAPPDPGGSYASWVSRIPEAGPVRFLYAPLPGDEPGPGGAQPAWSVRLPRVAYLVWQARAMRRVRRRHRERPFDLAWHLTWANVWLGSSLSSLGIPFVLGPVGGAVAPPFRLALGLGIRGIGYETARWAVRSGARWFNPLARRSWTRAALILVQNEETRAWLPASARSRTRVFNNTTVVAVPTLVPRPRERPPTALFAGRLIPWKGWRLAVEAVAGLPDWRLIIFGEGPDADALEAMVASLGIGDRVQRRGWRPRDEVLDAMAREADVFLFPSLHDEAGFVVAEAAAIGLPIVCLDVGGPARIAGSGVRPGGRTATVARLRDALRSSLTTQTTPRDLSIDRRRAELRTLLSEAGLIATEPEAGRGQDDP